MFHYNTSRTVNCFSGHNNVKNSFICHDSDKTLKTGAFVFEGIAHPRELQHLVLPSLLPLSKIFTCSILSCFNIQ